MSDETTTPQSPEQLDLVQAVWQLRVLVAGLCAGVLVLSLAFNAYVWKQNRNLESVIRSRQQQGQAMEARINELGRVVNEFAEYSINKPELAAIFTHNGLQLKPAPATSPAAPAAPATQP